MNSLTIVHKAKAGAINKVLVKIWPFLAEMLFADIVDCRFGRQINFVLLQNRDE